MKRNLLILLCLLLLIGCISQNEEKVAGQFIFPNTNLSITVPVNWSKTTIPGYKYPILFTDIHYGIKPNIRLEDYSIGIDQNKALENYFVKNTKKYPDYHIEKNETFSFQENGLQGNKIQAKRTNDDNIPIIQVNYVFKKGETVYILSATCAEPSFAEYADLFDRAIKSVKLSNYL